MCLPGVPRDEHVWGLAGAIILSIGVVASAADWEPVTKDLLAKAQPGYGGLSGVLVDPRSGDIYVNVSDRGIFRSKDQGGSWQRVGAEFKGRTEWPGCLMVDPVGEGKRVVVATVYGAPIARVQPREIGSSPQKRRITSIGAP